jgi:predicted metal-dependent phosphoesterase TrpH
MTTGMTFADLHLHTHFSDGTYSPQELVAHAKSHGLAALALTDHDTVEGCDPTASACARLGIEFISGTELTAEADGHELHLIGYLIDLQNPELLSEMARFQAVRQDRIREIVARLNQLNIPLQAEAVFALASCRSPGRPHVGRALVQAGFCSSMDEAFERFLKKHRPAWVPKCKMSAQAAIELIHQAGGVAVLAHPGLNRKDDIIPELATHGLDGLECYHSKHSASACEHYVQVAEQHGLLITGGSDCHGLNKGKPLIGSIKLPYQHVAKLKLRAAEIKARLAGPAVAISPNV